MQIGGAYRFGSALTLLLGEVLALFAAIPCPCRVEQAADFGSKRGEAWSRRAPEHNPRTFARSPSTPWTGWARSGRTNSPVKVAGDET